VRSGLRSSSGGIFLAPRGGGGGLNHDFLFCNSDRGPLSIPAYRCILSTV